MFNPFVGSTKTPAQNPLMEGIRNIINTAKAVNNKDELLNTLMAQSNNEYMQEAVKFTKENGGDPKTACFALLRANGINPDDISKMINGKGGL